SLERCESTFLVSAHQAAIACNIGRKNCCQPPFDPRLGHNSRPARREVPIEFMVRSRACLSKPSMSALGQKQTFALHQPMSAFPPIATVKADISKRSCLLYPRKRTPCSADPMAASSWTVVQYECFSRRINLGYCSRRAIMAYWLNPSLPKKRGYAHDRSPI